MTRYFGSLATAGLLLAASTTVAVAQSSASAFSSSPVEFSPVGANTQLLAPNWETNVRNKATLQPREVISDQLSQRRADRADQGNVTNVVASRSQNAVAPSSVAAPSGPRIDAARAGIVANAEIPATAAVAPVAPAPRVGQNVALMIVGGAALITGVVIGGDGGTLLAIGGAVVGLIGLYQYVK